MPAWPMTVARFHGVREMAPSAASKDS